MKLLSAKEIRRRNKERVTKWRDELKEKGYKSINVMVSPEVFEIIQSGKKHRRDSNTDAIERICKQWNESKQKPLRTDNPKKQKIELSQNQFDDFDKEHLEVSKKETEKYQDGLDVFIDGLQQKQKDPVPDRSDKKVYTKYIQQIILELKHKGYTHKQVAKELENRKLKTIRAGKKAWSERSVSHLYNKAV